MKHIAQTIAFVVIAGLYTAPAVAQIPDTTSAERYLPLGVGSVWEYESWIEECPIFPTCQSDLVGYERWTVERDSLANDTTYAVLGVQGFSLDGEGGEIVRRLVRFDSSAVRGFRRLTDGEEVPWPSYYLPCRLDAPFQATLECEEDFGEVYTDEPGEIEARIGTETETRVVKQYQSLIPGMHFAADIGLLYEGGAEFGGAWIALRYARVGNLEYGTERFPVASESAPPRSALALAVYPNPTSDAATVRFTLDAPQRVTLAVYDVLGRRVLADDLGAQPSGEGEHRLDTARLTAGLYIVRLDGDGDAGATATARVVRH